jgi:copper(I)-binding protein
VPLPARKRVEFKPGGFHLMLVDLVKPLGEGDKVPLTLTIEDKQGKRTKLEVTAPVRPLGR